MIIILQLIWFGIPGGISNATAPISKKLLPMFNAPVDFGIEINGKRLFGKNKSFRGFIFGTIVGTLVFLLQRYLYINFDIFREISLIDYEDAPIYIGSLLGFGALFGDLIESFFKRRLNINSGESWFPFDQIDWILGMILLVFPFVEISIFEATLSVFLGLIIHIIVKYIGFLLKLDDKPI